MGRQRFLHHYLPSHVASALVAGSLIEFILNVDPANLEDSNTNSRSKQKQSGVKARLGRQSILAGWAGAVGILSATIWGFYFFGPLTYGTPGLDVAGVKARQWLSYDLHFAK